MLYGNINSIETMGLVDGPGIRYVVFMQGCKLRCLFCHNPETWFTSKNVLITPEQLIKKLLNYKNYFGNSGGITFSGGEPLCQPEFLLETLKLCKKEKINTCIDTSGVGINPDMHKEILKYTDLVILDIKSCNKDNYKNITGHPIDEYLDFLNLCQNLNKKLWLRQVIIPQINDNEEYIFSLKKFVKVIKNVEKIELLPYHTNGVEKYKKLNLKYRLKNISSMDKNKLEYLNNLLNS